MANIMEFSRGDGATKGFSMPASSWSAGGRLFFAAKAAIDDDTADLLAQVKGDWGDDTVTDTLYKGTAMKRYACYFPPGATNTIPSNGAASLELLGEFQWVPSGGGDPITAPANDEKIDVVVYMDVKRKTVV